MFAAIGHADTTRKNPPSLHLQPILVSVNVNEEKVQGIFRCYIDDNQKIWVDTNELHAWGLNTLPQQPLEYDGERYYELDWYQGVRYVFDSYALALAITVPPRWLPATRIGPESPSLNGAIRPQDPGLFVNYDVTEQHSELLNQSYAAGTAQVGYFNHWGVGTSGFLFNSQPQSQTRGVIRLDTTWTLDEPEKVASWRFGDSITSTADWSGAVHFGGIQYATNFSTQPNLVTFPLPGFSGEAAVPSTVDVFVNSALRQQQRIRSGPFYVNNIPVVTGAGAMQIVTQDILGREQVSILPYYASEQLLTPGLIDFSYEAGAVRLNYGLNGNEYGRALLSGTYSRGLTNNDTATAHAELLANQQTVGFTNYYLLNYFGVLTLGGAASHSYLGEGGLAELAFRRQTPQLSFGGRAVLTTQNYLQLGILNDQRNPSLVEQAFASYSSSRFGSFSVSYTALKNRTNLPEPTEEFAFLTPNSRLLTVSYSQTVFKKLYLLLGVMTDFDNHKNNQIYGSLVWSLGKYTSANISGTQQQDHNQGLVEVNKNLPLGNGTGYRLLASSNSVSRYEGDFAWNNPYSTLSAQYANVDSTNNYQLNATGSVIHFGGSTFLARSMESSFALVQVPGFENVKVYYRNQSIGRTDKKGNLYIPNLLPYQENDIKINAKDLPLDTIVDVVDKQSIPYFRSGALVRFPVHRIKNVMIALYQANHHPVPAGATVVLMGQHSKINYPVGYEGKVFLYEFDTNSLKGRAMWDGKTCHFTIRVPQDKNTIIDLGKVACT